MNLFENGNLNVLIIGSIISIFIFIILPSIIFKDDDIITGEEVGKRLIEANNRIISDMEEKYFYRYSINEVVTACMMGMCVILPCRIGDIVYELDKDDLTYESFKITDITITDHGIGFENPYNAFGFTTEDIGNTIFLTEEEVKKKIKEIKIANIKKKIKIRRF